ncbi:hypothetical protein IWW38_003594, partial [Coemansia aciculifera]
MSVYTRHNLRLVKINVHDDGKDGKCHPVLIKETKMWTTDDVQKLIDAASKTKGEFNVIAWQKIADRYFPNRTADACKKKYELLLRDISAATSSARFLKTTTAVQSRGKKVKPYDFLSTRSKEWTLEDDKTLLALCEVWDTQWDQIAKSIGKYTGSQCKGRYYWLRKKNRLKKTVAGDRDQEKHKGPLQEQQNLSSTDVPQQRARWTEAETKKLRDLIIAQGRFDYKEASKQLPGFSLSNIYYELDKVLSGPDH